MIPWPLELVSRTTMGGLFDLMPIIAIILYLIEFT
jgi:hypothetical protein